MSTDQSGFDQYQRIQIQGVSSVDDSTPTNIHVDPTTNEVLVQATGTVTVGNPGDIGGGTQYTEGATDATITGTVGMWEDAANTIVATSASKPLPVEIVAGAGSGGTASADDADFTAGTTSGTPAMGVYESSPTSVTDNDMGIVGITQTRALKVQAQANSGVDIGDVTINNATIAVTQSGTWDEVGINDSGNSITVDGTVTADLGATDNAVLDAIAASTAAIETAVEGTLTVTGGGGGTEYTEDAGAAVNPVGTALILIREDARAGSLTTADNDNVALRGNNKGEAYVKTTDSDALLTTIDADTSNISTKIDTLAGAVSGTEMQVDILTIAAGDNNIGNVDIASSALPTGASTLAEQQTQTTHLATIAGDTTDIETAVELIDDTVATLGTTTYTEAATKGLIIGAIRRDADTTLVDTTNEVGPLQMNAAGQLKVEVFSGEALPVTMSSTTVTGTVAVTQSGTWDEVGINDSGNSITVDGTIDLGATDNAVLDAIAASVAAIDVDTTAIIADTTNIETAVQLIDDVIYTDDADWTDDTSKHTLVGGLYQSTPQTVTDGDVAPFNITANGALHVSDAGGSLTVDGTVTANLSATDNTVLDNIDADTSAIQTAVEALDNAVDGNYLNVNMNIAGTDVSANAGVLTAQTLRVTIATDDEVNNLLGTIDADTSSLSGAVSGTEMQVDVVGALPAGTNAIGKLAANSGVDIGDVTLTAGTAAIGTLLPPDVDITTHTNYAKKYYTNSGAVTDGIIWSPAAGKRWHIHTITINVSAAATVTLEDDLAGGDSAIYKAEFAANSGIVLTFPEKYPWASGEDAADLIITTSAGNVYVTCVGYEV